ncbi:MAG: phage holin family protein, partial [Mycobacteriales bacterium]
FGGAGVVVLYAVGCLVAAAVLALDLVFPAWAAALIVAGSLLLLAVVAGLIGKKQVTKAVPPVPKQAMASVKLDLAAVKR